MRVLVVTPEAPGSGVERYVTLLETTLRRAESDRRVQAAGVLRTDASRKPVPLARELRGARADAAIFTHASLLPELAEARVAAPDTRRFLVLHGAEIWECRDEWRLRLLLKAAAPTLLPTSRYTMRSADSRLMTAPLARVEILPALPDPPPIEAMSAHTGHEVLCVTDLNETDRVSRVDKLVRAMVVVRRSVPDARLTIVGDGNWRPELERLVDDAGLETAVQFAGPLGDDDRRRLQTASDVFALPSAAAGFDTVYLEAWVAGLPVVAAADHADRHVIENDVSAVLADDDVGDMAHAMTKLLRNPQLRRRMGAIGRHRVVALFSAARFEKQLLPALQGVVGTWPPDSDTLREGPHRRKRANSVTSRV